MSRLPIWRHVSSIARLAVLKHVLQLERTSARSGSGRGCRAAGTADARLQPGSPCVPPDFVAAEVVEDDNMPADGVETRTCLT